MTPKSHLSAADAYAWLLILAVALSGALIGSAFGQPEVLGAGIALTLLYLASLLV